MTVKPAALICDRLTQYDSRIARMAEALETAGYAPSKYAMTRSANPDEGAAYAASPGILPLAALALLGLTFITGLFVSAPWTLLALLAVATLSGIIAGLAPLRSLTTKLWAFASYRLRMISLSAQIGKRTPAVIVCCDINALPLSARLARKHGVPLVYDAHEYFREEVLHDEARKAWVAKVEEAHAKNIDLFITVNTSIARQYEKDGAGFPPALVIHNQSDAASASAYDGRLHAEAGLAPDTRILLYHGGLAPMRGLERLARLAPHLERDWAIVVMGIGAKDDFFPAADEMVRFVEPKPMHELGNWIRGATLGAILYEGGALNQTFCSPNKLWQYPAVGVPVLVSPLPELRRVVETYGSGFVVPEDLQPEALAEMLANLSPDELADARKGCARQIRAESWDLSRAKLIEHLAALSQS